MNRGEKSRHVNRRGAVYYEKIGQSEAGAEGCNKTFYSYIILAENACLSHWVQLR